MFRFALKNMAIKKVQILLVILSIVVSAGIGVLSYNVAEQVSDGITSSAAYYGVIIGPAGSKTQLAMNTMYFTDSPLGTIPYSIVTELNNNAYVNNAIPFAMADNYNGTPVVGTVEKFLKDKDLKDGRLFSDEALYEVVVGSKVAKDNRLSVGSTIVTGHSATELHEANPLTVVGILEESHTSYDNEVFTQLKTLWAVHGEEEEEEEEEHEEGEVHVHDSVCAILLEVKNPSYALQLVNEYDGKIVDDGDGDSIALTAIEPMETVRSVLQDADNTKYIVFVLCAIILLMNIIIISIITLLNMVNSSKEISLMRLIGISMKKINLLYIIENGLIGLASTLLAFGVSRLCLGFMQEYVASMGVVLNAGKVYPLELVILFAVFFISVVPTVICTYLMSKKDGMEN